MMKLFTQILTNKISEKIPASEEQQGFTRDRSTTDAIFIVRQITEKVDTKVDTSDNRKIKYEQLALVCFVDLTFLTVLNSEM